MSSVIGEQDQAETLTANGETKSNEKASSGPKRRKKTEAEKEASRLKTLRERYGDSTVDRSEPNFSVGFPRNALGCAFEIARKLITSAKPKRVNPERIAEQTSQICPLTPDQKSELVAWLKWLKPRRFVASDPHSSPVLLWALSKSRVDAKWDGDAAGSWMAAVEREHAKRMADKNAAKVEPANGNSSNLKQAVSSSHEARPDAQAEVRVERPILIEKSEPSPSSTIRRPSIPHPAFVKGETLSNAFFGALQNETDGDLIAKAKALARDQAALLTALARTPEVRRCIETIFNQIGLPLPKANT